MTQFSQAAELHRTVVVQPKIKMHSIAWYGEYTVYLRVLVDLMYIVDTLFWAKLADIMQTLT